MPLIAITEPPRNVLRCPYCEGKVICDGKRGEYYCENCGTVVAVHVRAVSLPNEREPTYFGKIFRYKKGEHIFIDASKLDFLPEAERERLVKTVMRDTSLISVLAKEKREYCRLSDIALYLLEAALQSKGYKYFALKPKQRRKVRSFLERVGFKNVNEKPPKRTSIYIQRIADELLSDEKEKKEVIKRAEKVAETIKGAPSTKAGVAMVIVLSEVKGTSLQNLVEEVCKAANLNSSTILRAVRNLMVRKLMVGKVKW